jgi:hypothetical protein
MSRLQRAILVSSSAHLGAAALGKHSQSSGVALQKRAEEAQIAETGKSGNRSSGVMPGDSSPFCDKNGDGTEQVPCNR